MNGQKLALGLLIIFLFAACLLQTSMLGCAKNTASDEAAAADASEDGPTFFSRRGSEGNEAPTSWTPVSENVMGQVADIFGDYSFVIASIERGQPGSRAVRCLIEPRDGMAVSKQLFDALLVLHQTYPDMNRYSVGLSEGSDENIETDWDMLVKFVDEGGYSFEMAAGEAENLWNSVQPGYVPEEPVDSGASEDSPMPMVRAG